jgi:TonB family protein
MKSAGLALLALSMFAGSYNAFAKEPAAQPVPIGSPVDWIRPGDYPRDALRLGMEGATGFRLTVDAAGKPIRCDITQSSGFDILDTATCERLMANARFAALKRGGPKEDTYVSRVVWRLSDSGGPMTENIMGLLLSLDGTGKVASCRMVKHVPVYSMDAPGTCTFSSEPFPPPVLQAWQGDSQRPLTDIELQTATVFSREMRERALAAVPGYEQRSLFLYRFTVSSDGKLKSCTFEEQRGSIAGPVDFCPDNRHRTFDPPFSAIDKDGIATGWFISRVLIKTAE